jgi:Domain of unknown function (DUF4259)
MGTWGSGIFENDTAADWVYVLEQSGAPAVDAAIAATSVGVTSGYVDVDTGACALAAAEAVAAAFGAPISTLSDEMKAAIEAHGAEVRGLQDIQRRAILAVMSVVGQTPDGKTFGSELIELWGDDDVAEEDFQAFMASLKDVTSRIKGTMEGSGT